MKIMIILVCSIVLVWGQELDTSKIRIGVFNLATDPEVGKIAKDVAEYVKESITEIGGYDIFLQEKMEKMLAEKKDKLPKYCREPLCVSAVGRELDFDRMLYGTAEKSTKSYGVCLTLVDVDSRKIIEETSIEGNPGVPLKEVIQVAVNALHGQSDSDLDTNTRTYYGKQVRNTKQMLVTSGSWLAAGLAWALISGAIGGADKVDADYTDWVKALCGIGTGADLIPLFARPAAMGNSYVAASDDAYGIFYNPAGLSWASSGEVSFCYQYRFGLNNFAASFVNKATREIGFGQGFLYTGDSEGLLSEFYFLSGISYKFNNLISFLRPFSLGASIKIQSKRAGSTTASPSSICGTASGIGLNVGFQWELSKKIRYGLLVRNVPSFIYWNNKSTSKTYFENEPVELSMGGTFQASYVTFLVCEGHIPLYSEQVWKFAGGVERIIFRVIRIRVGAEKSEGIESPWKINGGFGINLNTESLWGKYFVLDGSYEFNTLLPFSNVMNFSFRFGF